MSDGMGRELAYLSSHATNRYFIPNWGNLLDVLTLALDSNLEGRKIVALLNLAEIGSAERQTALYEKRIVGGRTGTSGLGKRSGWHLQESSGQAEGK